MWRGGRGKFYWMKSKDIYLAESIIEENSEIIVNKWNDYFGTKKYNYVSGNFKSPV